MAITNKNSLLKTLNSFLGLIFFENFLFHKLFLSEIRNSLSGCQHILEIGAGENSYLNLLDDKFSITAFDIHEASMIRAKEKGIFDHYVLGDVRQLDKIINIKSFDAVVAFDFIEHLTKDEGSKFISAIEKIAKKVIIIYTPNGYFYQPPAINNAFQEHLSGWEYDEMASLGFNVIGVNGYKGLTKNFADPKIRPIALGRFIRNLSWILFKIFNLEKYSFSILCIKNV